jgi:hypothetical protein
MPLLAEPIGEAQGSVFVPFVFWLLKNIFIL